MCLYPRLIQNPKYKQNGKNGGNIPPVYDTRILHVPIGCGNCMECRKKKAREWQVRLLEDLKEHHNGKFITLTYSNESIKEATEYITSKIKIPNKPQEGYDLDNQIATTTIRLWLERWRKKYKKSLRHWMVTELGHEGTENIHLHGIVWTNEEYNKIQDTWKYGFIWPTKAWYKKTYVNEKTVNYIIKYVNKRDEIHKTYKSIILTSAGIGRNYTNSPNYRRNAYKEKATNELYKTRTGHEITIPIYWRNKLYTEEEREKLWLIKLDKQERWINGQRVSIKNGYEDYDNMIKHARQINKELGYGDDTRKWKVENYEHKRRQIIIETRIQSAFRGT